MGTSVVPDGTWLCSGVPNPALKRWAIVYRHDELLALTEVPAALNAEGVGSFSPALTRQRSGYAGKLRIRKPTLKELNQGLAAMMQPFQGWRAFVRLPRVATSSQPWAERLERRWRSPDWLQRWRAGSRESPAGRKRIAQRFNAGTVFRVAQVPAGTAERRRVGGNFCRP